MIGLISRNLKVFFRDPSSVFFSLLAVFIIIGLYALFLGNVWVGELGDVENARHLMDSWIMAGLLAVTTLTTTLGALGTMVDDRSKKIIKDFYSSPVKRSYIAGGYVVSAFLIGVILSLVALVLAEIYIVAYGGSLLGGMALLKVFGLILLSSIASTSMVFFLATFLRSQNAFGVASTVIGILVGFLTGIYLPTGMLPESIQYVVKCFPISHAAVLLRKVVMEAPLAQMFSGAPEAYRAGFEEFYGISLYFGERAVTPAVSILILLATAVVFFGLSVLNLSKKSR